MTYSMTAHKRQVGTVRFLSVLHNSLRRRATEAAIERLDNPVSRASRCIRSWKSCGGALPAACSCPEAMAGEMGLAVEAIEIMVVTLSLLKNGSGRSH